MKYHKFTDHSEDKEEGEVRSGKRVHKTPDRVKCSFCSKTCATRSIYYKLVSSFGRQTE